MEFFDPIDCLVLFAVTLVGIYFATKKSTWSISKAHAEKKLESEYSEDCLADDEERNIVTKLRNEGKNCVVFFGSQTGTAESYAKKLAREASCRFGLGTIVADLEEFDPQHLQSLSKSVLCIFVLATYGEGDPTDNAQGWWDYIADNDFSSDGEFHSEGALNDLRYMAFGLGNKSYENYNAVVKRVDQYLIKSGATRLGTLGLGDDAENTTEEDYLEWKEKAWAAVSESMNLDEKTITYTASVRVTEHEVSAIPPREVFKGHLASVRLQPAQQRPLSASNPYLANIAQSRELFTSGNRNCLHIDINLKESPLAYTTGDHVGIAPINPSAEVDRFLSVFGLLDKRHDIIHVSSCENHNKLNVPSPTTLDALARYYLEICGAVSRQLAASLAQFAPNEESRQKLRKLGSNREHFHSQVSANYLNLAQMCQRISPEANWSSVPVSLLIEEVGQLKPRFYSISSSSALNKNKLSITAVVESVEAPDRYSTLKGVMTNYLLGLKQKQNGEAGPAAANLLISDADMNASLRLPIHIRTSKFRLPRDVTLPAVMVGPGTGVAPFRAFIQERMHQARSGIKIGRLLLFFGCRRRDEDFIYAEEWKEYKEILGSDFEVVTAFSREGPTKTYVQHRLLEHAEDVDSLLKNGGYFYVCGDASSMAREVNKTLGSVISRARGLSEEAAAKEVQRMRSLGRYQEDVW